MKDAVEITDKMLKKNYSIKLSTLNTQSVVVSVLIMKAYVTIQAKTA